MPSADTTRRRASGRRARTASRRAAAAGAAAGAALVLGACGAAGPERDRVGAIEQAGETRLLDLRGGDCIGDLRKRVDDPDGGHNGDLEIKAVPCAAAHDGEVLRIAPLEGDDWPGSQIVDGEAARGRQDLQPRLQAAEAAGPVTLFSFRPTQERWEFEDQRKIVFIALYDRPRRGPLAP